MAICRRHVLFDHDYDDRDTTRMYCSELVNHAYASNGIELAGDRRHDFNVPGLRIRHVILPADFIGSPRVRTVAVFPKTKN